MTHRVPLGGCSPVPLADYLKALGVLRLVSKQCEPRARGHWEGEVFVLTSGLDREDLVNFFLRVYRPTPIIAPWNGGSGFYEKDNQIAIDAIRSGSADRLEMYRLGIAEATGLLGDLGIGTKVGKEDKPELLEACRGRLPEGVLDWLDAAYVLSDEGPGYPPLLGTGGNDGRLDFTNNFMQRVVDLMDPKTGQSTVASEDWLRGSLFDDPVHGLVGGAIGQFDPSATGAANAQAGFSAATVLNPWDYVLMIEGTLLFAAACARRLASSARGILAYPFAVRQSAAGYGSASSTDARDSRAEMWFPLWDRPATVAELSALMSEGRATVAGRRARDGVDFARAVATLGVDRGITSFERYGFQVRNGLAYFATPLGRFAVERHPEADLLEQMDPWLDRLRRSAGTKSTPAAVKTSARRVEGAIVDLCRYGGRESLFKVFVALGDTQRVVAKSFNWAKDPRSGILPLPPLDPAWLNRTYDGSPEFRIAAALASVEGFFSDKRPSAYVPLRSHLHPVNVWRKGARLRVRWREEAGPDVIHPSPDLTVFAQAVFERRLLLADRHGRLPVGGMRVGYADRGRVWMRLEDVAAFLEEGVDDPRVLDLLQALVCLDWPMVQASSLPWTQSSERLRPDAAFSLLKLCFAGWPVRGVEIPTQAIVFHRARAGAADALSEASRRLRASGLPPAVKNVYGSPRKLGRVAATALFPLGPPQVDNLADEVLRPRDGANR